MTETSSEAKHVKRFLILTFVLSWIVMGYIIYLGGLRKAGPLVLLAMWVPGLVSLLYRKITKIGFKDVGWRLGATKYWAFAFFVPLVVAAIAYTVSWLTGVNTIEVPSQEVLTRNGVSSPFWLVVKIYPLSFLIGSVAALGEEIGWRGFLIPKLCNTKVKHPLFISSLIWGVWHYPLIFWGGYASQSMTGNANFSSKILSGLDHFLLEMDSKKASVELFSGGLRDENLKIHPEFISEISSTLKHWITHVAE